MNINFWNIFDTGEIISLELIYAIRIVIYEIITHLSNAEYLCLYVNEMRTIN